MKKTIFLFSFIISFMCTALGAERPATKATADKPVAATVPSEPATPSTAKPPIHPIDSDTDTTSEVDDSEVEERAEDSDTEEEKPEEDLNTPREIPLRIARNAAQMALNKLTEEGIDADNLGELAYALNHHKYRKTTVSINQEARTVTVLLENSVAKDKKEDKTFTLKKEEALAFLQELQQTQQTRSRRRKPGNNNGGNKGGENDNSDDDDDEYDDDDENDKVINRRFAPSSDKKTTPQKRSTPESRNKRLNPQRRNNARYGSPQRYNPRRYNTGRNSFTPRKQKVKKATIIEGKPRVQEKKKTPVKKEETNNRLNRTHASSRVPSPQRRYKPPVRPSPQNVDHERRTQKVGRTFEGLPKRTELLDKNPAGSLEAIGQVNKSQPLISSDSKRIVSRDQKTVTFIDRITNWFTHVWESFKNLLGWN